MQYTLIYHYPLFGAYDLTFSPKLQNCNRLFANWTSFSEPEMLEDWEIGQLLGGN